MESSPDDHDDSSGIPKAKKVRAGLPLVSSRLHQLTRSPPLAASNDHSLQSLPHQAWTM